MAANRKVWNGCFMGWVARGAALAGGVAVGLTATGCALFVVGAAAGVGAASVAYIKGDLRGRVQADPCAVERAAVKAFEVLTIRLVSSRSSANDAEIIGRTTADERVTIEVEAETEGESSVSIRIDTFGDEAISRKIYDEIKTQLPNAIQALEKEREGKKP